MQCKGIYTYVYIYIYGYKLGWFKESIVKEMKNEARDEGITVAFKEESDMKKMGYICWKSSNFFLRLEEASK